MTHGQIKTHGIFATSTSPKSQTQKTFKKTFIKKVQGRVVRKPVNANPGLEINRSMYFSCIKTFFTAYVLCSLRLFKFKTEGQKI